MSTASAPAISRPAAAGRVVLVHGGTKGDASGGANAEDFHLNFAELAKKFHVISIDRLGQGYTDNPKRDEDWTMGAVCPPLRGLPQGARTRRPTMSSATAAAATWWRARRSTIRGWSKAAS